MTNQIKPYSPLALGVVAALGLICGLMISRFKPRFAMVPKGG